MDRIILKYDFTKRVKNADFLLGLIKNWLHSKYMDQVSGYDFKLIN